MQQHKLSDKRVLLWWIGGLCDYLPSIPSRSFKPSCGTWGTWGTCGGSAGSLWRLGADADLTSSSNMFKLVHISSYFSVISYFLLHISTIGPSHGRHKPSLTLPTRPTQPTQPRLPIRHHAASWVNGQVSQVRHCWNMLKHVETCWNTRSLKLWSSHWCNPGSFNFDVTFLNLGSQLWTFSRPVKSAPKAKTWSAWRALWVPELQSSPAIPREHWLHKGLWGLWLWCQYIGVCQNQVLYLNSHWLP